MSAYPLTEVTHLSPIGLGSITRGFVDPKTNSLVAAFRYPGTIGFVGTMDLATGKLRKLAGNQGHDALQGDQPRLRSDGRAKPITPRTITPFATSWKSTSTPASKRMLLRDARIGDLVVNPADKTIWGIRHQNGFATIVRIPQPYAGFNQVHTFDYGQTPFDLDISPDGALVAASFGEIDGKQSVRVWTAESLLSGGGPQEVARLDLPPSTPEELHLHARWQVAGRHGLLHRRVERLYLRHREPEI